MDLYQRENCNSALRRLARIAESLRTLHERAEKSSLTPHCADMKDSLVAAYMRGALEFYAEGLEGDLRRLADALEGEL